MTTQLVLFAVTLDWGDPGSDEGDYATWVWAEDDEQAVGLVAEEMANSGEKTFDTDAERAEYIKALVATAGTYAVQKVSARVFPEIEMLMKGPAGELTADAQRDFASIKALIAKHGAAGMTVAATTQDSMPTVVLEINGGVINCARSTQPVRLIVLDEDTEGGDEENIMEVNGEEAYVHDYRLTTAVTGGYDGIDTEFVVNVIEQIEEGQ